jgi:ribosomal-protein-alanine N-acetyltransferase
MVKRESCTHGSVMRTRAKVRIEAMTEPDLQAVANIAASAPVGEDLLREELARPWSRTWVAREEEGAAHRLVAFIVAWHVADELHVLNVTTRADRRRRGIGRALMDTAVAYGREKRVKQVLLEVRRSNDAAIALYRALGFYATRVRPRYYPDDEDAVEMVLLLDPRTGEVVPHDDEVDLDESRR